VGFLIVQDIVVVIAMVVLSAIGVGSASSPSGLGLFGVLLSGLALLAGVAFFVRFAAERLLTRIARLPELLMTFAIAWAVLFAALCDWIGLGKELGGLLAGVSLASTTFREAIASRLSSLRDFLLLFFFIALGSGLQLGALSAQAVPALVLSAFVLIGNPLIVMVIMGAMGYRKRTGFFAGLTVAQISEFSLIFIAMGLTLGHVTPDAVALVTLVGLITITCSTYMILYSHPLYRVVERWIGWTELGTPHREADAPVIGTAGYDVIIIGLGRYGRELTAILRADGAKVFGVDFDPEAVAAWRRDGLPGTYGDAGDPEFPATLPLEGVEWIVITTPPAGASLTHDDSRVVLTQVLRGAGFEGKIAVRSDDFAEGENLKGHGAAFVLSPYADAAFRAAELIRAHSISRTEAGPGRPL
jgi:voltage-gated potassium channel Kch